jgi:hypothetical protein
MLRDLRLLAGSVLGLIVAATIPFVIERGTEPAGDAVLWGLYGAAALAVTAWVVTTILLRRRKPDVTNSASATRPGSSGVVELRSREELREWLDVRIEEMVAWRAVLDEETGKPVPNIDRTQSIESLFWDGLNRDVARKLQLLAPEWAEYWGEGPDWFYAPLTRITSEQVAEFSRLLGWEAERLRHIKRELP